MKKELNRTESIERSIDKEFRIPIWRKFTKALAEYKLIQPNDKICVCISGGKDSMLMALLFKHLLKYTEIPFEATYLVMNPGYNQENENKIRDNLKTLGIPAVIVKTDIFEIANQQVKSACYLCAKMRRGALYRISKQLGCNKIALGHHYDDVIGTTLMNMLNSGSFQTMMPKLHSDHYSNMEIIRPLYLIREEDIISWCDCNELKFIACACRFTEAAAQGEEHQRAKTKKLIAELVKSYSPYVEKNIFKSASNVTLDMCLGYNVAGELHSFLDTYEEDGKKLEQKISEENLEGLANEKAESEHREFEFDYSICE